jgi:coiled-coil-helix-coiled-coil-helix domain-containing protein 10
MGGGGGLFGGKKKGGGGGLFGGRKAAPKTAPRRTFGSRAGARKIPPRPAKKTTAPATTQNAPPPARRTEGGGIMSGIASTVVQGMAFGTGSAIAHRAVGGVANAISGDSNSAENKNTAEPQNDGKSCEIQIGKFYDCLDEHDGNIGACQFFFDLMQQCQKDISEQKQFA